MGAAAAYADADPAAAAAMRQQHGDCIFDTQTERTTAGCPAGICQIDPAKVSLTGVYLGMKAAIPLMRLAGGGSIVNISSIMGIIAIPAAAAYTATKGAVRSLTKQAALSYAPDRIRVNAIAPAGVETPIWTAQKFFKDLAAAKGGEAEAFRELADDSTLLGRFAKAEEVAAQMAFLLSDQAGLITGTCLVADGGYSL